MYAFHLIKYTRRMHYTYSKGTALRFKVSHQQPENISPDHEEEAFHPLQKAYGWSQEEDKALA